MAFEDIFDSMRIMEETSRIAAEQKARRDAAILQTAANSETQIDLLENQLKEARTQNELLRENYNTLKDLYERVKQEAADNKVEAETSRRAAKKARRLNIAAFVLSTVFPIASIVASVLIALYI